MPPSPPTSSSRSSLRSRDYLNRRRASRADRLTSARPARRKLIPLLLFGSNSRLSRRLIHYVLLSCGFSSDATFAAEIEKGMSSTGCQNNSRPLANAALFPSLLLIKRHDILPTFSSGSGRFRRGFLSKLVIQSPLPSRRCLLFATQLSLL